MRYIIFLFLFYATGLHSQTDCSSLGEMKIREKVTHAVKDFEHCVINITSEAKDENKKKYFAGLAINYFPPETSFNKGDSAFIEISYPKIKIRRSPKDYFLSLFLLSKKKHVTFSFQSTRLEKIKKINNNEYEIDFSFVQCICYKENYSIKEIEKRTEVDCIKSDCTPKSGKVLIRREPNSGICKIFLLYIKAGEAKIR